MNEIRQWTQGRRELHYHQFETAGEEMAMPYFNVLCYSEMQRKMMENLSWDN
jgi:hypothetical protein